MLQLRPSVTVLLLFWPSSCAQAPPARTAATKFGSLTLVGERWNNGEWARLGADGKVVGPMTLKRGDDGAVLISSPRQSPVLLALSTSVVVCGANDTAFISSDGGRSWARYVGHDVGLPPSVPAPRWMKREHPGAVFMDVQPIDAYLPGCYKAGPQCEPANSVTAAINRQYTDWIMSANSTPVARRGVGRAQPNTWGGLPTAVAELCTECGGGVQLLDGSYIFLAVVQFGSSCPYTDECNNVVAFASKDGMQWNYTSTVGAYDVTRVYQEGPNECDIALLRDNKTLWAVMRVDGGDGHPSHRTLPMLHATSTDSGRTWSKATPLPPDMRSSKPSATVLGNGALLVSAGRPGLDLFISRDGFGDSWERHSIPTIHNRLQVSEGKRTSWRYCEPFVSAAANHTYAGDPKPRVDTAFDGGPLKGFTQTSGYTALTALDHDVGLVCYDKQGWGAGYYGVGLPPIFGDKGIWPKGRSQPLGCFLDVSYTFCMRVTVPSSVRKDVPVKLDDIDHHNNRQVQRPARGAQCYLNLHNSSNLGIANATFNRLNPEFLYFGEKDLGTWPPYLSYAFCSVAANCSRDSREPMAYNNTWLENYNRFKANHLQHVRLDLDRAAARGWSGQPVPVPTTWAGLVIVDYEGWKASWTINTHSSQRKTWQTFVRSINSPTFNSSFLSIVAKQWQAPAAATGWTMLDANHQASLLAASYNHFAKDLFTSTIRLCRSLRPLARFGYYNYPQKVFPYVGAEARCDCGAHAQFPSGGLSVKQINDELDWLWAEVDVLNPDLKPNGTRILFVPAYLCYRSCCHPELDIHICAQHLLTMLPLPRLRSNALQVVGASLHQP